MAYFYFKNGVLHRVENGYQYGNENKPEYLPTNDDESMGYAESRNVDLNKAKRGVLTSANRKEAKRLDKRFPSIKLSDEEKAYVTSELNNHLSDLERGSPLVCQTLPWNNEYYTYTVINFGFDNYKIIRRVFSDVPDSIADIVMEGINQYE